MKTKFKIIIVILLVTAFFQACECPLETSDAKITLCNTKIITMEKFNPNFTISYDSTKNEYITTLDSTYNISVFLFPMEKSSSGSFPNDTRFSGSSQISIAKLPFVADNKNYYASILDLYPTNSELVGDILVVNVNPLLSTAQLRFYGSLNRMTTNFYSENSQEFCDYVKANIGDINTALKNKMQYGDGLPNAQKYNYASAVINVIDERGNIIGAVGSPNVPQPPPDVLTELQKLGTSKTYVDLTVSTGEVYVYEAKNGLRFVFVVSEIRQSTIIPFRKRVSIMFYPLQ